MFDRTHELDLILAGALDATGGRPCWPGCTLPVEDGGTLHICDATALTTTALHGEPVEVRGGGAPALGAGGVVIDVWQRGTARGGRRPVTDHIALRPEQALAVGEALVALARQAGAR